MYLAYSGWGIARAPGTWVAGWLEDLVAAAFNDAAHKVEATVAEKMSGMTAGLGLPPGFKLPF